MPNTSATAGYLTPAPPPPAEDAALNALLQQMVSGITGLPGSRVRPRWQPEPPNQLPFGTDWCAIGVTSTIPDTYAHVAHDPEGDGADRTQRHATVNLLASFYGPNSGYYAGALADGLMVEQNRDSLRANAIALQETGEVVTVPELIKQKWYMRKDLPITLRRRVDRTYGVLNVLSAKGLLQSEASSDATIDTPINVTQP